MSKTKDKDFRDGDGDSTKDALFQECVDVADRYYELLERLLDRMKSYGISTFVVLSYSDPLTGYTAQRRMSRGNYYQNIGAARSSLAQMENEG